MEWFNALAGFEKVFWSTAIVSSLFFIVQMVLTFFGADDTDSDVEIDDFEMDGDADDSGSKLGVFTVRNMVAFFMGFSWSGLACIDGGLSKFSTIIVASIVGVIFVSAVMTLLGALYKLQSSGTMKVKDLLKMIGKITVATTAKRANPGKAEIKSHGKITEWEVYSDKKITRNKLVTVVKIEGNNIIVEEIKGGK